MGNIHCCGALHRSISYEVIPEDGYILAQFDWLEQCPNCLNTVCQLTRIDYKNEISVIRKTNAKARNFREKIKSSLIKKISTNCFSLYKSKNNFYLYYNEFGKKKKCFSNLSAMKMGLGEDLFLFQDLNFT